MSHTHEDRVADRPPHLCAAYGCPLIGSMCSSTSGSTEWWCFAHYGATPGRYQLITTKMHRVRWLAMAVHDVRFHGPGTQASRAAFNTIERELNAHGREDLLWQRPSDERPMGEKRYRWLERLEAALKSELADVLDPSKDQAPLPIGGSSPSTFEKVGFDMPV